MRISIFLIFLSSFVKLSANIYNNDQLITNKGVGNCIINQSNFKTIKSNFPKGKTSKKIYFKRTYTYLKTKDGRCLKIKSKFKKLNVIKKYELKRKGISFIFRFNLLYSIRVWGLNNYKTDKGIIVGKSTFNDLDSLYGETEFYIKNSRLVKNHDKMFFFSSKINGIDKKQIELNQGFDNLSIEGVEISLFKSVQI